MATTANRRNTALKDAMTKTQILDALSESTGLQKKDVASVLDELGAVIERHVRKCAVGTFTLPGLLKIKVVRKPATKARKMMSPFTRAGDHGGCEARLAGGEGSAPERAQAHDGVGPARREGSAVRAPGPERGPEPQGLAETAVRTDPSRRGSLVCGFDSLAPQAFLPCAPSTWRG